MKSENMKRRVEEMQSFPHTAARPGGNTAIHHRITTSPQNSITNSSTTPGQFHLMTVLKNDQPGTTMVAPTTNIQYTYTPTTITNPPGLPKTTNIAQASNQVHVVNTTTLNMSSAASAAAAAAARTKAASSIPAPTITTTQQPHVVTSPGSTAASAAANATCQSVSSQNFPRLKVEDALSYLDQVKYKFGNQPQVYNDFLDIMKEFKSQSIDTPGVIQRVSNLFKGHPELIVGFNTFLPPGYKIEVQANDQGFAYQVSVSVPSPSGNITTIPSQHSPQATKLQIIQGPGHIIQQSAVNLITHSGHPTIHIQPSNTSSTTNSQSQDPSRPIQNTTLTSVNLTQNFSSVNRDRATNNLSGNATSVQATGATAAGQQNQINTTTTSIQHTLNPQQSQANDSNIRISQYPNDNQPVQFNQAIVYVNKIKCRFQEQPEKYKHFLRILHKYQNEQRKKDNAGKSSSPLTESEVFKQVAHLFDNQEDLLREFGQFLPDATPANAALIAKTINSTSQNDTNDKHATIGGASGGGLNKLGNNIQRSNMISPLDPFQLSNEKDFHFQQYGHLGNQKDSNRNHMGNQKYGGLSGAGSLKRSPGIQLNALNRSLERNEPPIKRHKPTCRDVSFADAAKAGTLQDYAFFDKVREALKTADVYDNFLRCLTLFNQEIVSKSELMTLVTPFLSKEPDLLKKFQEFLKFSSQSEAVPLSVVQRQDLRAQTDTAAEIDVAQCKRLGTSYCALPKTSESKKCSGRTPLCREVLNDIWVSFPSWSEDSTFNASRKTQYEEFIYRCEDERFELDVVIETNSATIRVLEGVQKKMSKMTSDEISRFKLDDFLGGTSQTIHQRALRRIYADKAPDIIEGLKKNPSVAVPVVLRRLKAKEEEWREAQKGFNQQWREQNEKYYLKSLDHQGINFKHTDTKLLRSKSLMNQIETVYEERNEGNNGEAIPGPHLVLPYKDKTILEDAANLLIHHVKRQTGIQKQEKARIKHILRQFVPELFFAPRQPLSEDEKEDAFPFSAEDKESNAGNEKTTKTVTNSTSNSNSNDVSAVAKSSSQSTASNDKKESSPTSTTASTTLTNNLLNPNEIKVEVKDDSNEKLTCYSPTAQGGVQLPLHAANAKHTDEAYTLFYGNSNWYYFVRLHSILCERLRAMYDRTQIMAAEEEKYKTTRRESAAIALRLKPQNEFEIADYYPAFLDMLKSLLDGNMDSTTYEDKLRDMFGIHAYVAFTLDRVVSNAVRQLQFCVTERNAVECLELFQLESRNHATGGPCSNAHKRSAAENAYHRRAESSLQEEAYFKIFIYKVDCRVTIEMIENENEDNMTSNFEQSQVSSKYVDRYANPNSSKNKSRNNSNNDGGLAGNDIEIKTEKTDEDMSANVRKPLFLARNISKFNRGSARVPPAKLLIKSEENSDMSNWKNSNDSKKETPATTEPTTTNNDKSASPTTPTVTVPTTTTPEADSSSVLTTSSSGVPPPLVLPKLPDPFWNKRPPERIGQAESYGDCFVDDQQQVKFNYNSYKSVFLTKGYILYRSNSLKRAKEAHAKVTKRMDEKFEAFVQKWLHKNVSDLQRVTINDWLLGRNQSNLLPNKTFIKRDNNLASTPYRHYNRYRVEFIPNENSSSSSSS